MKKLLNYPKFFLCLTILIGLMLIWINLDLKVLHHDESLNAIYGLYYYLNPATGFYKYDPMLHGPFLYHLLPWIYHLFDESHFSLRVIPALCFSLIPLGIILGLRKRLDWIAFAIAAVLITGPSYVYWARFLRHDQLVLLLFAVMAFSVHSKITKAAPYLFFIPLVLQFCVKENAYIHLSFFLGFFIFNYLVNNKDLSVIKNIIFNKKHLSISLSICIFIYCFYYSAGFKYPAGILDGLYRKSLSYWMNQHSVERISGPFLTQFFTLFWYELPFVIILFSSVIHIHLKSKSFLKFLPLVVFLIAAILHGFYGHQIPSTSLWSQLFKLKIGVDFYGLLSFLTLAISGTWILIKKKNLLASFFYYWTMASFFTYSYLGEKVPWLSVYILVPGVVFLGLYFRNSKIQYSLPILVTVLTFNIFQSYKLNHLKPGTKTEFISQVHTTREYEDFALKLQGLIEKDPTKKVLALKDNTWPLTWYLYGRKGYHYRQLGKDLSDFDIILDSSPTKTEIDGYDRRVIGLRHWWVPSWRKMNLYDFVSYSFTHSPWNSTGTQNITIFYKDDLLNF